MTVELCSKCDAGLLDAERRCQGCGYVHPPAMGEIPWPEHPPTPTRRETGLWLLLVVAALVFAATVCLFESVGAGTPSDSTRPTTSRPAHGTRGDAK